MLCAFATWRIINGTSWFLQAVLYEHLGEKLEYDELPHYRRFLTPRLGGPRNRNQMAGNRYILNFHTTTFTHPSVQVP